MTDAATLSLDAWGDIATFVLASASVFALVGAWAQIRLTRATALLDRAYDYADRFNQPEIIALSASYREYWTVHTFGDFTRLDGRERSRLLILPNLIEEAAAAYNRDLIDKDVAAQMLGVMVEMTWEISAPLIRGARKDRDSWVYAEWEEMTWDTQPRRLAGRRDTERRRRRLACKRWWDQPWR